MWKQRISHRCRTNHCFYFAKCYASHGSVVMGQSFLKLARKRSIYEDADSLVLITVNLSLRIEVVRLANFKAVICQVGATVLLQFWHFFLRFPLSCKCPFL